MDLFDDDNEVDFDVWHPFVRSLNRIYGDRRFLDADVV